MGEITLECSTICPENNSFEAMGWDGELHRLRKVILTALAGQGLFPAV